MAVIKSGLKLLFLILSENSYYAQNGGNESFLGALGTHINT